MRRGQRVRWYLMGMGTEVDLHTPHWHGNTVLIDGHRQDVIELLPASLIVADMKPDDPGTWLYHCHVGDHILAGMLALYQVNTPDGASAPMTRAPTLVFVLALALVACGDPSTSAPPDVGAAGCDGRQLLLVNCSGCHDGVSETTGFFDLRVPSTAVATLVGRAAAGPACGATGRILVNDDGSGLFVDKLAAQPPCGDRMPQGTFPLTTEEMACVAAWIATAAAAGAARP